MSSSESDDSAPLSALVSGLPLLKASVGSGSDSDNEPLSIRSKRESANAGANRPDSDSESDQPLSGRARAPPKKAAANGKAPVPVAPKRAKRAIAPAEPKRPRKIASAAAATAPPKRPVVKAEPKTSRHKTPSANSFVDRKPLIKAESSVAATSFDGSEGSDSEDFKWWLESKDNTGPKWKTLEHFGVMFPPEYEPHGLPLLYRGKEIKMHPHVEEVATFFAALLGSDNAENKVFQENFFKDFKDLLDKHMAKHPVKAFSQCDFTVIRAHLDEQKATRKAMTKAEKEAAKKEKLDIEEKYGFCMLDGRREKVGNFRIEPPGLFRGRGAHPKTGMLKTRVLPEQVTINIGSDAAIPDPPSGHSWGKVIHDNTVTWLAMWKENINSSTKYVFLAAGSSLKGQSDMRKFDKARNLVRCIDDIRAQYTKDFKSDVMAERQRATALYLIDRYALRAGNEKGEDEADTVGCCSLRCEHVSLEPPNVVHFDFLGKDSIRYERTTEVDILVWRNLRLFQKEPKVKSDMLFDRLTPTSLNSFLHTLMPGLTAKVFRTFNASFVFQRQLLNTPKVGTEAEKILAYNRANREVAVLCNHQRAVSKSFQGAMTKIEDKLLAVRYQRQQLKDHLMSIAPTLKKLRPDIAQKEPGVTAKWIKTYLLSTCELDREKARKKFERDNEKLKEANEPVIPESTLNEQLDEINAREASIGDGTYEAELPVAKNATTDKILEKIDKLTERISNIEVSKIERDENKTTALSTSKINYIDPRISVAWCKKNGVPLEKIFNRALREKFTWAMEVDSEWTF
ncbi:DNA topoisomerase 1 [Coemansia thaxteri]|uniref:DNA topoisomerase I n=1 Tax=Coemansia thaxteri TaxID=2663907 RepID=A0A9W8BFP4_9FUNG|nr:DNA topoisomerase 1 [Coemansia thaxteri]KAJ2003804.1 DNA topoisomerase 1 [Coemansia thaxteri]KAJ2473257.1 DNA topoisomerase 1 [Coemansia sp. RSA 2322]KAJ2484712.1 DNA topoisomerase 1 [Coemansia sp. RSA 2320]